MIYRPETLACIHCGGKRLKIETQEVMLDYYWRYVRCNHCGLHTWWGSPHSAVEEYPPYTYVPDLAREHLVMKMKPKWDRNTRLTTNLAYALPVGATVGQLLSKATLIQQQRNMVSRYMFGRNKTELSDLTLAEKIELKGMLDKLEMGEKV